MTLNLRQRFVTFVNNRSTNLEERTRLFMFLASMTLLLLGMPMHLLGLIGTDEQFLLNVTVVFWLSLVAILLLYIYRKLTLIQAISVYAIVAQLSESVRIIYLAVVTPDNFERTIVVNLVISFAIVIYLVLGFVKTVPVIVTAINLATLLFASNYNPHAVSPHFTLLFSFIQIGSCVLGYVTWKGVHTLQNEATDYLKTQDGILEAFHMSKQELVAYLQMCRRNNQEEKSIHNFFRNLDEQSEKNLINAVEQRLAEKRLEQENFALCFPQLTPTELEVCRLVMNGKTVNDIARILDKNANNIGTVRIHIRKKLGLKTGEDLRQFLVDTVKK